MRGTPFGVVATCLAVFLAAGCSELGPVWVEEVQGPTTPPNIVLVLVDDLDYASAQKMPAIDSLLVKEGASFGNAFASHSTCCPSRATILTGLYAHNHGVKSNMSPNGGFGKFRDDGYEEGTIAVRLQEEGYRTALFGKYLNLYTEEDPTHVPPGWDEWQAKLLEFSPYNYGINENGAIVVHGNETEDYDTDVLSREITEYVRSAASDPEGTPFFMYVVPTAPHQPATPAERHEGAFAGEEAPRSPSFDEEDVSDKPRQLRKKDALSDEEVSEIDELYQRRLKSMLAVDEMVESLVEELKAAGALDDTYIFFTSDNGFHQGEHRIETGKDRPYEESARVPLFVRGPGVPAGLEIEKLALNTDLAPTFAQLAGAEFPVDGRSLAPLLRGEYPPWRSAVLLEGEGKKGPRAYSAIRTETHKYVEYGGRREERELYELEVDPYELENAYETLDSSFVEDLKAKLDTLRDCSGAGCREAEDAYRAPGILVN